MDDNKLLIFIYLFVIFISWATLKAIKLYINDDEVLPLAVVIAWWVTPLVRMLLK